MYTNNNRLYNYKVIQNYIYFEIEYLVLILSNIVFISGIQDGRDYHTV